jgi:signal transduction histidine kinase
MHLVIETGEGLTALLIAYLLYGRFRLTRLDRDALLVYAFTVFGLANLFLSALPAVVSAGETEAFSTWAPVFARLLATVALAVATVVPRRQTLSRLSPPMLVGGAALAVIVASVALFNSSLPTGLDPGVRPDASTTPHVVGHPAIAAIQLISAAIFGLVAYRFTQEGRRTQDDFWWWLAAGCVLAAFARLNYFLFPSLYSDWVYTGDFLRLGFYLLLLFGAAQEIGSYWQRVAAGAARDERRRLAHNLHDGLAQELAYITMMSRQLSTDPKASPHLLNVAEAAERALDESRRAMAVLASSDEEALDLVVAQAAEQVAYRAGATVHLDLQPGLQASNDQREALIRIVREAVTHAIRRAGASTVTVRLRRQPELRLVVIDDGTPQHGNGLSAIHERAAVLGGSVHVSSHPSTGSEVEVVLP